MDNIIDKYDFISAMIAEDLYNQYHDYDISEFGE